MGNDNTSAHPAALYDAEIRKVIPFYDAIQSEVLGLVRTVAGAPATWLDTGCGTGVLVEKALPAFPGTRFYLADPSAAMLEQARQRLGSEDRVTMLGAGGSAALPGLMGTTRVHVVTAMLCHHYLDLEGRLAALRACQHILEPGGALLVVETVEADGARGREIGLSRWREYQLGQGRAPDDVDRHLGRYGVELLPIRVGQHLELLRKAGFQTVEIFWRAHLQAGFLALK